MNCCAALQWAVANQMKQQAITVHQYLLQCTKISHWNWHTSLATGEEIVSAQNENTYFMFESMVTYWTLKCWLRSKLKKIHCAFAHDGAAEWKTDGAKTNCTSCHTPKIQHNLPPLIDSTISDLVSQLIALSWIANISSQHMHRAIVEPALV